jgi:ribosomal-protein-alanine N-acetyltransferase
MLRGQRISLRPIKQADLDELYDHHVEIATRGSFYPLGVMSETTFRKRFDDNGFWDREEGTLVIVDGDGRIVGEIEFFRAGTYWDAYELAYHLYDPTAAGKGYTTEAVQLLADYLFANKARHRLQLIILPGNAASRRIAEKCGFQLDGTIRQPFFHGGENVDVLMYSLLRTDPRPWREAATPEV